MVRCSVTLGKEEIGKKEVRSQRQQRRTFADSRVTSALLELKASRGEMSEDMAADCLLRVWDERHAAIGVAHDLVGVEHGHVELLRKLGELRQHACNSQVSVA